MANIILDYDGTIHNCAEIYVPAFYKGYQWLVCQGLAPDVKYSFEEVSGYLGYSAVEMWKKFMPDLEEEYQNECGKIIGREMMRQIESGNSVLYDGARNALKELKEAGHTLIFLSNCMNDYMNAHRKAHGLDRFYRGYYCTEDFGFKSKPEIFKCIKENYQGEFVIVGDRFLDLEIAFENSLKSVGCLYGYCKKGELEGASITVGSPKEIPGAVESLL